VSGGGFCHSLHERLPVGSTLEAAVPVLTFMVFLGGLAAVTAFVPWKVVPL
jgi:hypothetical protein